MLFHFRQQLQELIQQSLPLPKDQIPVIGIDPGNSVEVDIPSDKVHGDLTCNIAMQLARQLKKNPMVIADEILEIFEKNLKNHPLETFIARVEVKLPGFINIYFSPKVFYSLLEDVLAQKENYGQSDFGQQLSLCLEFVSANPTGPLTVAHGRQAAVGDSLANILKAVGYKVKKEYYVNDEGNQINTLGRSILFRAKEVLGEKINFPENGYQGDYIGVMAKEFIKEHTIKTAAALDKIDAQEFCQFGVDYLMKMIQKDLEDFNVHFDGWSYQSKIATRAAIEKLLKDLQTKGHIYQHEGAWWFKSTEWGDDKDRVVKKSDGDYTYLMMDMVYHKNKFARDFKHIVDILGPDHHGYLARLKATAAALGQAKEDLDVIIVQLATVYRQGKAISMSTRRGEFITLREVMDEVGKDAGRFFFLMRQSSAHLDFDLELAKKNSMENPVYYIQYAHSRIHSILRNAVGQGLKSATRFYLLDKPEEIDLIRNLALYPQVLLGCARQLEPYGVVRYLQELAGLFHRFYDSHRVLDENKELSRERLGLIEAVCIVIGNGLRLLGVTAPEKM